MKMMKRDSEALESLKRNVERTLRCEVYVHQADIGNRFCLYEKAGGTLKERILPFGSVRDLQGSWEQFLKGFYWKERARIDARK